MWGPAIMFMIIGVTPLIIKKVGGVVKSEAIQIYKNMFRTGFVMLIFCFVGSAFPSPFHYIIPSLPILPFCLWMIHYVNKMFYSETR